ncbi:MAG: 2-amino-4-hydroxy-6-hydroxymethyldihydropteridine diphosphokinase [Thiotrichales bacterium]|jgi:2-amino-4-hydroxy-6-hydroxymethyldihydropteridine diphosphokinase|nr:2-amino-4-hydroxy-6-hydroxymethyldihydropteridine diphosphokinase [Thiotrichales bacterium]
MRAFLGLGANLAQPELQLQRAIDLLREQVQIDDIRVSRFYASQPMGPQNQPDYINAVASIETSLAPLELLDVCQSIEQKLQRVKGQRWGARTIDVDILSIDQLVMETQRLVLPHPGIAFRDFVLLPWKELAPDYIIPKLGRVGDVIIADSYGAKPIYTSLPESLL